MDWSKPRHPRPFFPNSLDTCSLLVTTACHALKGEIMHSFLETWVTTWCSQPKMHRSDRDLSYKSAIIYFNVFISVGQYYLTCSGKTLRSSVSVGSISARSKFSNLHYLTVFAYKTEGKFLKYLLLVLLKSPSPFNFHRMKNVSQLKPEHYMDHARASAVFHLFKCLSWSAMHLCF